METYCNPLDLGYRYQHLKEGERIAGFREGADPTLVYFKGKYYLFVSMSAGFWYSDDLLHWDFHADPDLLIYDYAPDVRQVGDSLYFSASRKGRNCPILRTADPLIEPFTEVSAPFAFWDPDMFCDDDGRVYFYWGCSNTSPIWGVELDPETMTPIGEKKELIFGREEELGYERPGNNGIVDKEESVLYKAMKPFYNEATGKLELPPQMAQMPGLNAEALTAMFNAIGKPYIEGAFMTKHNGTYYLQYACPGTQYNTYADGVYTSKSPLGPFTLQASNPFSSKPGGFMTGAGHGSTIADKYGNYWHASTMRISVNHDFERRVGLFPAGFDKDGVLFCNQNFADYPHEIPAGKFDAASQQPKWMLLSYRKAVTASSTAEGSAPTNAVDEDCRRWWSAGSDQPGEWLCVDLGRDMMSARFRSTWPMKNSSWTSLPTATAMTAKRGISRRACRFLAIPWKPVLTARPGRCARMSPANAPMVTMSMPMASARGMSVSQAAHCLTGRPCASAGCVCSATARALALPKPTPKPCVWTRWTAKSVGSTSRTRRAAMCATALHRISSTKAGWSMMPMRSRFPR